MEIPDEMTREEYLRVMNRTGIDPYYDRTEY